MALEPCPHCRRHVRTAEVSCPFCGGDVAIAMANAPRRMQPAARLGRAALVSFGLAVGAGAASASLEACGDDGGSSAVPPAGADGGGSAVALYGAAVLLPDAGRHPIDAGFSNTSPPYGSAPFPQPDAGDDQASDAGSPDAGVADAGGLDAGPPRAIAAYGAPAQSK